MASDDDTTIHFGYNSDLDAFDLYHLVQEGSSDGQASGSGSILPALGHAMAGAIASAIAKASVYPIDIVTTRLQVQKQFRGHKEAPSAASNGDAEYRSLPDAIRKIYRNEGGVSAFYSGCLTEVTKGIIDSFCFFLAYTVVREQMVKAAGTRRLPVLKELGVGVVAGCFSKAITSPIQNVVTRQQTAALAAARSPSESAASAKLAIRDIVAQIRREKGLSGFWSGYSAAVILTMNPAITFAAEKTLKRLLPRSQREHPSASQTFILAALSKVIATSVTYPITMAKSRAMASSSSSSSSDGRNTASADSKRSRPAAGFVAQNVRRALGLARGYAALFRSLRNIYRADGVAGLYSGLEGDILKGFLQHGLTMMVKEGVHGNVVQLYFALCALSERSVGGVARAPQAAGVGERVGAALEQAGTAVSEGASELAKKVAG